jgi:hypothetical protein
MLMDTLQVLVEKLQGMVALDGSAVPGSPCRSQLE